MSTRDPGKTKSLSEVRESHSSSCGIYFTIKKLLYRKNSPYQRIEVIENDYFGKILLLDGLVQTTERDEFYYHEMLVHPACAAHPVPHDLLVIGGGDGGALKEILRYPIKRVCLVEIDSQVIEVSKRYFPWLSDSLKDARTELVIADGREYIDRKGMKFDIVFVDSSDPVGPSASLHEKEFFRGVKNRLSSKGVIVAQVGSPFYHLKSIKRKGNFLGKLFRVVHFYVGFVPTYPGGSWCFVFLSDEIDPLDVKRNPPPGLKYYNGEIHKAAFALPNFFRKQG